MGSRGPAPTPTSLLKVRGSWRAKKRSGEPTPPVECPPCPDFLKGEAKREWQRLTQTLLEQKLLTQLDRGLLAAWCEAWAEFLETRKLLDREGYTTVTDSGTVLAHPVVWVKNAAVARLLQIAGQFGLSPAARTRIRQVHDGTPKNADRFYRGG
jgi:P27 family predicted phage terminase small subunit